MTSKQIIEKAKAELGVTEYPANSNNVKYNTWYYGKEVNGNAYPWCCTFISWLFKAEQGLCKRTASCLELLNWFESKNQIVKDPQPGDIVFFKYNTNNRRTNHVGLVVSVYNDKGINTIEGNTSINSDDNGGKVMQRNRYSNIVAYARPHYSDASIKEKVTNTINVKDKPILRQGSKGEWVKIAQARLVVNGLNINVDGSFGPQTKKAVMEFQKEHNLVVDGIIGSKTWDKLYL